MPQFPSPCPRQKRELGWVKSGAGIEGVIREECDKGRVTLAELESGVARRKVSGVRASIAFRCAREIGLTAAEIARHVGVNTSAVTRAITRAEKTIPGTEPNK
jgi:hypothetical protein